MQGADGAYGVPSRVGFESERIVLEPRSGCTQGIEDPLGGVELQILEKLVGFAMRAVGAGLHRNRGNSAAETAKLRVVNIRLHGHLLRSAQGRHDGYATIAIGVG